MVLMAIQDLSPGGKGMGNIWVDTTADEVHDLDLSWAVPPSPAALKKRLFRYPETDEQQGSGT